MKKTILAVLLLIVTLFTSVAVSNAYVSVKGYTRKDGTYVKPHVRSNPNGLKSDNYSYTPSQGAYNKTYGTRGSEWDTPTYITDPNYYEGKALYESGKIYGNYLDDITPTKHYSPSTYKKRVFKTTDSNTIWELSDWSYWGWGTKKPFTTANSFLNKGYKWSDIKNISKTELDKYKQFGVY